MKAEGHTNCKVAKWAEGHRQEYDEKLEDVWNTKHSWVGKEVQKMFDNVMYNGTIEQWLPDSKSEWELWRIKYDDGDMEDLGILELLQVTKEHKDGNLASNKDLMPLNTTKRELTRKDKRRERKRRRQLTNNINEVTQSQTTTEKDHAIPAKKEECTLSTTQLK